MARAFSSIAYFHLQLVMLKRGCLVCPLGALPSGSSIGVQWLCHEPGAWPCSSPANQLMTKLLEASGRPGSTHLKGSNDCAISQQNGLSLLSPWREWAKDELLPSNHNHWKASTGEQKAVSSDSWAPFAFSLERSNKSQAADLQHNNWKPLPLAGRLAPRRQTDPPPRPEAGNSGYFHYYNF